MKKTTRLVTSTKTIVGKGLVEYTNKLILQYIPKGADFDDISPHELMDVQKKLNNRPRKKLNFSTPKLEFFKHFN